MNATQKLEAHIATGTLDQHCMALQLADTTTQEGMIIRVALINHIEKTHPAICEWVKDFYSGDDDDPRWDIDYPDAILLARAALEI